MSTRRIVAAYFVTALHAPHASAMNTEFLPNGGLRYTLFNGDFTYDQYTDANGVKYIDAPTGWMKSGLCILNNVPIATLQVSLDKLAQKVAAGATGDNLGNAATVAADNLFYCQKHGNSPSLLRTAALPFAAAGKVSVRITYAVNGLYAGIPGEQINNLELQRIFRTNVAIEVPDTDNDDLDTSTSSIRSLSFLPRIADLQHHTYGTGFGRVVKTVQSSQLTSPSQVFELDKFSLLTLSFTGKAYGFDVRIESIELTYTPGN